MPLPEGLELARDQIAAAPVPPRTWQSLVIYDSMPPAAKKAAIRLNGLGSLYYFGKIILAHSRFSPRLHAYICSELERDSLRLVLEIPRDHFKTSCASVCAPMWWGLPFTMEDEDLMGRLGYDASWLRWMKRAHDPNTRTLIASEVIGNARKIGVKIEGHYHSNAVFRWVYPSIIPHDDTRWNQDSMTHRRMDGEYHGEGTYDFIGVKGALQSRHYKRQVIDDAVGEKAILSDGIMESTIDWVQKLPGAFDSDPTDPSKLADQLFIGNRWSMRDLNSWIRKNVPKMFFITHSAEGGCCARHPHRGEPIFPEEFSMEKLREIRAIEGPYNYAAQYLNAPTSPEATRFKESWLRRYSVDVWKESGPDIQIANWQQLTSLKREEWGVGPAENEDRSEALGAVPRRLKVALTHEAKDGEVIEDIRAGDLDRFALMDPNHSGEQGRSRNAILIVGIYNRPPAQRRLYLLGCWAKASGHEEWLDAALSTKPGHRGLVVKWRCHALYIESEVAGQQGWKYAIKERMKTMGIDAVFAVRPLKTDRALNAKHRRIIGMESIFENGFFWVPRIGCDSWMDEYTEYPNGSTLDLLDLTGYLPQCWISGSRASAREFVKDEMERGRRAAQSVGPAGY